MAAVIGDYMSDSSRFRHSHMMGAGPGQQRSPAESPYRQRSRSRVEPPPSPKPQPKSVPAGTPPPSTQARAIQRASEQDVVERAPPAKGEPISPPSSRPGSYSRQTFSSQQHIPQSSASLGRADPQGAPSVPRSDAPLLSSPTQSSHGSFAQSAQSLDDVKYGGSTIMVKDLAHIQSFATEDFLSQRGAAGRSRTADEPALKYEISGMPITDIIEMVAGLLTKITTTNDRQHDNLTRPILTAENTVNTTGLSSSVLAFHGKNVPSITILSYLSRIHKYCPTTYEVFLSLLVYFDRMTERVNAEPIQAMRGDVMEQDDSPPSTSYSADGSDLADSPPPSRSAPDNAIDVDKAQHSHAPAAESIPSPFPLSHFFVVDSFNIHRLVIAGVTCASKFFSDVFYTNSRYAKVGGLPLAELNHLELQFLLLNEFRLSVPVEELEAYGTMLVEFYAREVVAQQQVGQPAGMAYAEDVPMTGPASP